VKARDGRRRLAVECDVSGLRAITVRPSTINSGIVVNDVRITQRGAELYLVVRTALPSAGRTAQCEAVPLPEIPAGHYEVFYGSPPSSFWGGAAGVVKIAEIDVDA
jgi:hypothetical protein